MIKEKKPSSLKTAKRKDLIFYIIMIAFPVLQFLVMYIYVNINSILLSFQDFNRDTNQFEFVGFDNILKVIFPINESTFEHLKLFFYPFIIISIPKFIISVKSSTFNAK